MTCDCHRGVRVQFDGDVARIAHCMCEAGWRARYQLPAGYQHWTLETWPGPDGAKRLALQWRAEMAAGAWLVILGPIGTGKTGLAVAMYRHSVDSLPTAEIMGANRPRFWLVPELLEAIKAEIGTDSEGATVVRAKTARCVVLDDLGTERPTEFNVDTMRQILTSRYVSMLPTIITTNLAPEELGERYGGWIMDRVRDRGYFVLLTGRSRRRAGVMMFDARRL